MVSFRAVSSTVTLNNLPRQNQCVNCIVRTFCLAPPVCTSYAEYMLEWPVQMMLYLARITSPTDYTALPLPALLTQVQCHTHFGGSRLAYSPRPSWLEATPDIVSRSIGPQAMRHRDP